MFRSDKLHWSLLDYRTKLARRLEAHSTSNRPTGEWSDPFPLVQGTHSPFVVVSTFGDLPRDGFPHSLPCAVRESVCQLPRLAISFDLIWFDCKSIEQKKKDPTGDRTYLITVPARYSAIEYLAFPLGCQNLRDSRRPHFPPHDISYINSIYFEYRTFSLHFRTK